jgi:23S rRNA (cytosine1962-C5)-methyltransferase
LQTIRRLGVRGFDDDARVDNYELMDAGDGARLERFGDHIVQRPHPAAIGERRRSPRQWANADLRFDRDNGWSGTGIEKARNGWTARIADLTFELRTTASGQVGVFPEHAAMLPWMTAQVGRKGTDKATERPSILNLFAYTGMGTLALARAGAAVTHVDAGRPAVAWARRNAAVNELADRPIRWLVDDAGAFVAREIRRERRYDGVILDPPTYGHGASGKAWRLEDDLEPLLDDIRRLLTPAGWVLLTAHTEGIDGGDLGAWLSTVVDEVDIGGLVLHATSGAGLELGAFARGSGAS